MACNAMAREWLHWLGWRDFDVVDQSDFIIENGGGENGGFCEVGCGFEGYSIDEFEVVDLVER